MHPASQICDSCSYERVARRAAEELRQPTYDELERVLSMAVERTDFGDIFHVLDEFGYDVLPAQTYEYIIGRRISMGEYGLANHAAQVAGRQLTTEECDNVAHFALFVYDDTRAATQMVEAGKVTQKRIVDLLDICLDRALPETAGFFASKLGQQFSTEQIERLRASCEQLGFPERLTAVYQLPMLATA